MVANEDIKLEQLDVKTIFLHGKLDKHIYIDQPKGYEVPRKEDHVVFLEEILV